MTVKDKVKAMWKNAVLVQDEIVLIYSSDALKKRTETSVRVAGPLGHFKIRSKSTSLSTATFGSAFA